MEQTASPHAEYNLAPTGTNRSTIRPGFVLITSVRVILMIVGFGFTMFALDQFRDRQFTPNVIDPWLIGIGLWIGAWLPWQSSARALVNAAVRLVRPWNIRLDRLSVITLALFVLAGAALTYNLDSLPYEMHGDQGHYALDAYNIVNGSRPLIEYRNTGREQLHPYVVAAIYETFDITYFMAVKLSTALAAFLMLPAVYWFVRTTRGRNAAVIALAFACVTTWFLIFGRIGYRLTWSGTFSAWTLAALWYGLQNPSSRRWAFILSGLMLGFGLYTYISFRLFPLVVAAALGLALLRQPKDQRRAIFFNSLGLIAMSAVVALPILSLAWLNPNAFFYRTEMFLGDTESLPLLETLSGMVHTFEMFLLGGNPAAADNYAWRSPVVVAIAAVAFYAGTIFWVIRAAVRRDSFSLWVPIGLLICLLPSALSIVSSNEVPSSRRVFIAFPIVMMIAATLPALLLDITRKLKPRIIHSVAVLVVAGGLIINGAFELRNYFAIYPQNYDIPLHRFSSDVMRAFTTLGGRPEEVYFGFSVGFQDFEWVAMAFDMPELSETQRVFNDDLETCSVQIQPGRSALFIVGPNDDAKLELLRACYPVHLEEVLNSPNDEFDYVLVAFLALGEPAPLVNNP